MYMGIQPHMICFEKIFQVVKLIQFHVLSQFGQRISNEVLPSDFKYVSEHFIMTKIVGKAS